MARDMKHTVGTHLCYIPMITIIFIFAHKQSWLVLEVAFEIFDDLKVTCRTDSAGAGRLYNLGREYISSVVEVVKRLVKGGQNADGPGRR